MKKFLLSLVLLGALFSAAVFYYSHFNESPDDPADLAYSDFVKKYTMVRLKRLKLPENIFIYARLLAKNLPPIIQMPHN